jgi:hypothetical protein
MTTATNPRPDIPLPAGANADVSGWVVGDHGVTGAFASAERGATIYVGIAGEQDHSGAVLHREILVDVEDRSGIAEIDAATARQVAADLLAAADELDQLNAGEAAR